MIAKIPMTATGAKKLQAELDNLIRVERKDVIKAISAARALGDLKENAEYHAAKERQSFIETRIQELEGKLSHAQIIDVTKMPNNGRVVFGVTVSLINLDTEDACRYQIVGEDEADIKEARISITSPLARALIGKVEGDAVDVETPTGIVSYEIQQIAYL